ncbi:SOS response-associated peptidase [Emticicia sp. 21SJ11W-3]|uniref:SOS response-associated peptidase n=1 Tax=Emticicia sp. 21SJ11W-3 TaxID=2916755 RepID=UPI00209E2E25|nr:SOS response-associated peptidase [Emticicia sp. 21SJ11W-3]UTA68488.1 SOS response-associated peptidase [Emticicia sp. 21SJ11W-3]
MCYRLSFLVKKLSDLAIWYNDILAPEWQAHIGDFKVKVAKPRSDELISPEAVENWKAKLDVIDFPNFYHVVGQAHPKLPIIARKGIFLTEWGLIPSWAESGLNSKYTLNARGEEIDTTKSYRNVHMACKRSPVRDRLAPPCFSIF